ncbi:hypothetical protein [Tenacibaculum dicentrarchi]|uniref:hypothetical protein n=1 Tax=Tenacibaculum dicentrarchi TaxID=669041 RepID=UPI0035182A8C
MKTEIATNQGLKVKLEAQVNNIIDNIHTVRNYQSEFIQDIVTDLETIELIQSELNVNTMLLNKHGLKVNELKENYPTLTDEKALSLIATDEDKELVQDIINICSKINSSMNDIRSISFETLIKDDEVKFNTKIDSKLRKLYTTYAENDNQIKAYNIAKQVQKVIKKGIEDGILSNESIGLQIDQLLNVRNGEIETRRILRIN